MGKTVFLINSILGILVGAIVALVSGAYIGSKGASVESITWFIAGIISVGFGIYEVKRYKSFKK